MYEEIIIIKSANVTNHRQRPNNETQNKLKDYNKIVGKITFKRVVNIKDCVLLGNDSFLGSRRKGDAPTSCNKF